MPPRIKFNKEDIIAASIKLIQDEGVESLTARKIAERLGSSVKPIFTWFTNMEDLKSSVISEAERINGEFISNEMNKVGCPPYKLVGLAYINFARVEPNLFKLLYMRDRSDEIKPNSEEDKEKNRALYEMIMKTANLTFDEAYMFHLEMWIFVHGIASMIVTNYLEWDYDFINKALTDMYQGLLRRVKE